jgi:hypothetical protein
MPPAARNPFYKRGSWTSLKFFIRVFYYPYQKFLEVRTHETFFQKGFWPPEAKIDDRPIFISSPGTVEDKEKARPAETAQPPGETGKNNRL